MNIGNIPGEFRHITREFPRRHRNGAASLAAAVGGMLAIACLSAGISHAQTSGTWTSATSGSWGNSANWSGGNIASGTGAVADFSTLNPSSVLTVTLDTPRTSGTLLFGDTTNADGGWTLTSSTLTLATASGLPTISVTGLGSAYNFGTKAATISSVIAGSNGLNKAGASALVLSAANTYSGTTTVSAGYLVLNNNSALGSTSGVSVTAGAGLAIGSGVSAGAGTTVSLAGNGVGSDGALTAISGGTGTWAGNVNAPNSRLGYQYSNLVISGTVGGAGDLIINGYGGDGPNTQGSAYAVTIGGSANYTGQTRIYRGILKAGVDNALPTATTLDIRAVGAATESATFDLNGFNQTVGFLQSLGVLGGNANAYLQNSGSTVKTFTANQAGSTTFFGIIQGNLAFTKSGVGNLTLTPTWLTGSGTNWVTGTNTFSGDTLVSAGTLTLGNANALFGSTFDTSGAGTLSFGSLTAATFGGLKNSGTVTLTNSGSAIALSIGGTNVSSTFAGQLTGAGSLTKIGSGTLTLTGAASDYAGNTTVSAGTLLLSNSSAIPGIVTAGRYSVAANATLATGTAFADATLQSMINTGNFAANSNLGVDTADGSRTFWSSLTGTVGLAISGGRGLTLSASNTLGAVTLTSSTLTLANTGALGGSGIVTVDGGTIEWAATGSSYSFNSRSIVVSGSGATFRNNTLGADQLAFGTLSGTGSVTFASGTGSGLIITGGNTYTGGTIIKPGTWIAVTSDSAFGSGAVAIEGGSLRSSQGTARTVSNAVSLAGNVTFNASGDAVDNNLLFSGSMTITGATRTVDVSMSPRAGATGIFFNGPISDGGAGLGLVKTGTSMLILGGANTYTGTTTIANGTLRLGNASALGGGGSLSFTGGTLQYTGSNTADYSSRIKGSSSSIRIDTNGQNVTFGNAINSTNTAGLTKSGVGTLTLSGSNSYSGDTTVNAGTLLVNGTQAGGAVQVDAGATLGGSGVIGGAVNVLGMLSPGNSPGVLSVASLTLGGASTSFFEINGTTRGTQYDGVHITGGSGPAYGGALSLSFGLGSAVADQTTFDLFSFAGTPTGDFSSVTSSGFYAGTWSQVASGTWSLVSGPQTLTFSAATGDIIVVPEPGALALAAAGIGLAVAAWARRRLAA